MDRVEWPFVAYCHAPTEEQERLLRDWGVRTAHDLVSVVRAFASLSEDKNPPDENAAYRKHLCRFLRYRCARVVVHFAALFEDKVFVRGGKYPDQWVVAASPSEAPDSPGRNDKEAPYDATAAGETDRLPFRSPVDFPRLARHDKASLHFRAAIAPPVSSTAGDAPEHLCCPLTLEVFVDPVIASSDTTYERTAIEKWLLKNAVDPLTNLPLATTALVPDARKKRLCDAYRSTGNDTETIGKGGVPFVAYRLFGGRSCLPVRIS